MSNRLTSEKNSSVTEWTTVISTILAVAGTIIGIWEFNVQQRITETQLFKEKIWEQRRGVYTDIARVTGQIIVSRNDSAALDSLKVKYQNLYYSFMPMCEDTIAQKPLVNFNLELERFLSFQSDYRKARNNPAFATNRLVQETYARDNVRHELLLKKYQVLFMEALGRSLQHVTNVLIDGN